jgi:two-component system sensor histidine kinase DctS
LVRQTQILQGLQSNTPAETFWRTEAQALLREHREWLRIESRDPALNLIHEVDTPLRQPIFKRIARTDSLNEMVQACAKARRINGTSYSSSCCSICSGSSNTCCSNSPCLYSTSISTCSSSCSS